MGKCPGINIQERMENVRGGCVRGESSLSPSINQSINTFITRHGTEARATVRIMPKQREMS